MKPRTANAAADCRRQVRGDHIRRTIAPRAAFARSRWRGRASRWNTSPAASSEQVYFAVRMALADIVFPVAASWWCSTTCSLTAMSPVLPASSRCWRKRASDFRSCCSLAIPERYRGVPGQILRPRRTGWRASYGPSHSDRRAAPPSTSRRCFISRRCFTSHAPRSRKAGPRGSSRPQIEVGQNAKFLGKRDRGEVGTLSLTRRVSEEHGLPDAQARTSCETSWHTAAYE